MARIKNQALVSQYRRQFPWCEACAFLDGQWPVEEFETHHIAGGIDRHDLVENIINVCRPHHKRATTHDLEFGGKQADGWNQKFLAIKMIKGELVDVDAHRWSDQIKANQMTISGLPHNQDGEWMIRGDRLENQEIEMGY